MLGLLSGIQKQIPLAPLIDYLTEDRLQQYGIPLPSYKAMPLLLHRNWAFSALMPPFPAIASISHEHPHILSQVWGWGIPLHAHQWKTLVWKTYVFFFDPQKSEIKPHTSQHSPSLVPSLLSKVSSLYPSPALYPDPRLPSPLFWPPKTLLTPILLPRMLCSQPTLLKTATSLSLWSFPRYPQMPPCFQSGPHPSVVHLTARRLTQDLRWCFHFWQDGETVSTLPLLLNAVPHAGQGQQAALESSEKPAVEGRSGKRAIQGSPIRQWVYVFFFST